MVVYDAVCSVKEYFATRLTLLFYDHLSVQCKLFRVFDECVLFSIFLLASSHPIKLILNIAMGWVSEVGLVFFYVYVCMHRIIDICSELIERFTYKIHFRFSIRQHLFFLFFQFSFYYLVLVLVLLLLLLFLFLFFFLLLAFILFIVPFDIFYTIFIHRHIGSVYKYR